MMYNEKLDGNLGMDDKVPYIMKRSGERVPFHESKIVSAITRANDEEGALSDRLSADQIEAIAHGIYLDVLNAGRDMSVEEIQDKVENALMDSGKHNVARLYITYRDRHNNARKMSDIDQKISGVVERDNEEVKQENSNKNPTILSVQRDYMAGEWSRYYTDKYLLPKDIAEAHKEGIIHFHDADYFAQHMANCFTGGTRFITDRGERQFRDFHDGDTVYVRDKDGDMRMATVHRYGKQVMQKVTLSTGLMTRMVTCTKNHRWILSDGTVTTDLKVGDRLFPTKDTTAFRVTDKEEAFFFCLGFIVGDGCDHCETKTSLACTKVRLCGKKRKYENLFRLAGFSIHGIKGSQDVYAYYGSPLKQDFINGKAWRFLPARMKVLVFKGYYAADGATFGNQVSTADERIEEMIEDLASFSGYYISSKKTEIRDTNYKSGARLTTYHFSTHNAKNQLWTVKRIERDEHGPVFAYCVDEPVTHSFTLSGGIVTGNCCLVNLDDMLQNGTCISGTHIDKPHSFLTACTVTSQIVAQVASSQYGGQTITMSHLAPFVDVSRKKIAKRLKEELASTGIDVPNDKFKVLVEKEVRKEVEAGCQTIQYQLITLQSTNGQAPFVTVFMYLHEVPEGQTRDDLALIIEVMLKQRILGVKDRTGVYITPAFPKLIYVLQDDNLEEGTKYFYLTKLAAECAAKRMVPDYISEKEALELKGDCYPCMGCVDGKEVIDYKINGTRHVEAFDRAWDRLRMAFGAEMQPNGRDMITNPKDTSIYDNEKGAYVPMKHMIRNVSKEWLELTFTNGRVLDCTPDHPFETNHGIKHACELNPDDQILIDTKGPKSKGDAMLNPGMAWLLGLMLCDGEYKDHASVTLGLDETDVAQRFIKEADGNTDYRINQKVHHRGIKGNYLELSFASTQTPAVEFANQLKSLFGGTTKKNRHIPTIIFDASTDVRYAFLAGMIDADGYINDNMTLTKVQIGSTNKELAIQQMLLAQSLGMPARIYRNHYRANAHDNIRYRVEFVPDMTLIDSIASRKKKEHATCITRKNASIANTGICTLSGRIAIDKTAYSYDVTTESEHFTVSGLYSHNCRSFLTPDRFTDAGKGNIGNALDYVPGKHKYYGRFNQGVVTINLVDAACSSGKDEAKFWQIMDERLELCHRALQIRHNRLMGTPSDVAPILWQDGALARLKPGETIDKLLFDGYSTISLGYAGLAEAVYYMKGVSHTSEEGEKFGLAIMQLLNDKCQQWKKAENIDYSVYGTPLESTTYKFAKCLQKRFGIIKNVTDHNYITNSYHVNVREHIDAFDKLSKEAEFQRLSPGGAVSYVEVPNLQNNIPAVLAIMKHIYNTILYAELNTKSDLCEVCGYDGEIKIVKDETGKLVWECPKCGNRDQSKMHVARRTCGYIGTQFWNQGRTQEIKERVLHLSVGECDVDAETKALEEKNS